MMMSTILVILFSLLSGVLGNDNSSEPGFPADPYLQYRPDFARSLPVQILLTGIVLTLVTVLFIHLVFTAQYHWPLAPVNYVLQLSGVTTLLISLIATLHVVLNTTMDESQKWPYMLNYVAVQVPPSDDEAGDDVTMWSTPELATWLLMNAATSGLIQITHIQFLTLLFPSRLEGRLIFTLLIPLAIIAAVIQLLPLAHNTHILDTASDTRNVCNATLSLLFTGALFLWGFVVNRSQAWRLDGGTAAFGAAALTLAVASTALNLLYIRREEEFVWLPGLMWAVVLWQNFLGWWWWVGSGSSGTVTSSWDDDGVEGLMRRQEKRARLKREKMARRRENTERARTAWRGVAGAFVVRRGTSVDHQQQSRRRRGETTDGSVSTATSGTIPRFLPLAVHSWYASLRHAHVTATRQQAVERVQRIRELERNGRRRESGGRGWGLGSFGWRIDRSGRGGGENEDDQVEIEMDDVCEREVEREQGREDIRRRSHLHHNHTDDNDENIETDSDTGEVEEGARDSTQITPSSPQPPIPPTNPAAQTPGTLWWWGPLRRWRLQDSTVY